VREDPPALQLEHFGAVVRGEAQPMVSACWAKVYGVLTGLQSGMRIGTIRQEQVERSSTRQ